MLKLERKLNAASLQHLKLFKKKFELTGSVEKKRTCGRFKNFEREESDLSAELLDN